jgi:hypothetical protein
MFVCFFNNCGKEFISNKALKLHIKETHNKMTLKAHPISDMAGFFRSWMLKNNVELEKDDANEIVKKL